ncbi:MAG: hypothetical protein EAZ97_03635 [Bacteroidetes bacterium]|nr:MAG: hypothetical protein EAZ97_03635 [Bacteroidota bacterium]
MIQELLIKTEPILEPKFPERNWTKIIIFLFFVLSLLILASLFFEDVVEKDANGVYDLRQERKDKFLKDSTKLNEECIQYALLAVENGFYPCLNCANKDSIFLLVGEVYKYGFTCNGEKVRYGNKLVDRKLFFEPQLIGNMQQCVEAELRKIIEYPLLPENLKRLPVDRLARPAGNPYHK